MEEYEIQRSLVSLSYQNGITNELFTFGWFVILGIVVIMYAIWLQLLDRTRVRDILLFGSLYSIGFILADIILGNYLGLYAHPISFFPFTPDFLIVSITVIPVLFMLVYQYTFSWRNYTVWLIICAAILSFILVPLYVNLGILKYYKGWNYILNFLRILLGGMIGRAIVIWFARIECSNPSNHIQQGFFCLRPIVNKPHRNNDRETDDTN